ncbi:transposase [Dyella choica]|uniref:Transposase IS4-like domain-containing protein n=1 Tax=Dyella choica TaxID=1927959 RepID=A0A432LYK7_9GAMM|nr:transposase [Dyella choica]RUL68509.1 hypothetical protein EKH80_23415 [Dyella choica]
MQKPLGHYKQLYALAGTRHRDLGVMHAVRYRPLACRVVLHARAAKGRKDLTCLGHVAHNSYSRKHAQREREPWLLIASPELSLTAAQIVQIYARRMQIELSFRDLKSHRYGYGFEDSLTRIGPRIEVLLLLSAMASFACWVAGIASDASPMSAWLMPRTSARRLYSILRIGREALARQWPLPDMKQLLQHLRRLDPVMLHQMGIEV